MEINHYVAGGFVGIFVSVVVWAVHHIYVTSECRARVQESNIV